MKKMFVLAILVSAALAGCHSKKSNTTPAGGGSDSGSAAGSAAGSGDMGGGSAAGSAAM